MTFRKDGLNFMLMGYVITRIACNFIDSTALRIVSAMFIITVIAFTVSGLRRTTKLVMGMLFAASVTLLLATGAEPIDWLDAVLQNGNVVLLLICGPFISAPFYYEDYQGELKTLVQARMRGLMSFLILVTFCTHILTVVISVSAVLIIYRLMKPYAMLYDAHDPFLCAVTRGEASSGFWSPAWASAIVYSVYPEIEWVRVIPVGIAFAVLFNAINLLGFYIEGRRFPTRYNDLQPTENAVINRRMLSVMLVLVVAMIASIVVVNMATGWDLILIVSIVSLLFPLCVAVIQRHMNELKEEASSFYNVSLKKVREQVALFTFAGMLGKSLDLAGVGELIAGLLPSWLNAYPSLMIAVLMLMMILPSLVGVHPAATGTAIIVALSPAALGLSDYTYCLAIICGWLLTIMISPFSAIALILSAETGRSNFSVSVGLNWRFGVVCLVVFSPLISLVGPMMG